MTGGDPDSPYELSSPHAPLDTTGGDLSSPAILSSPHPCVPFAEVGDDSVNDLPLLVATDGDPTEQALPFSIHSVLTFLSDSDSISRTWPAFAALRGAARATKVARLRMALSALVSEARIVF